MDNAEERNEMTTAQEVEDWRVKIKKKIWSEFAAEPNEAHGKFLMKKFDELCDTALLGINALAENARLKAALDRYSEDEVLLIERFAKACESVYESYESKCDTWPEARPDALSGAEDCIRAIRTLKEAKK